MYGEGKRPDYPDVDKDGNRKESMESAVKNAKVSRRQKAKKAGYQNLLMKTKKIIKQALKQPELYTEAELAYLRPYEESA